MSGDRQGINNLAQLEPTIVILADGRTVTAMMAGSVKLRGSGGGCVSIKHVLYVPGLRHGLFSVGSACDSFADGIKMTKNTCTITATGGGILSGK